MGNIALTDEGRDLLVNWELAMHIMEEDRKSRPDRAATNGRGTKDASRCAETLTLIIFS